MPRFFCGQVCGDTAVVTGEDARHMALSLRMKIGEAVTVCDGAGRDYQCRIETIAPEQVLLRVGQSAASAGEPRVEITLYHAMPKGDKFESIVQKAVELGAARIVPVLTHRCVSRPDEKAMCKKLERYNRIALEAAKQCGRGRIPQVEPMLHFSQAVERMKCEPLAILFYENADQPLHQALRSGVGGRISLMVGSEGGFEPSEAGFAVENGLLALSLGSRILRCETAPVAALAAILYAAGEF